MITIQDAINHATDNGFVVSETFELGMRRQKSFYVKRGERVVQVVHAGGKRWVISVLGGFGDTQALCIMRAVGMLLEGEPER